MSRYMILDREVENNTTHKRFCNPFDGSNFVVADGWKYQGDAQCSWAYYTKEDEYNEVPIPDDITILVGHNIKFDLMWGWRGKELRKFFKRGGRIWDTQYAEYLIHGAVQSSQMVSMDTIIENYGGRKKIDAVKQLWEEGYLTSQIDRDMLIDYLVGTESEGRNSGDIGNTELIFLGQLKEATRLGMTTMIFARMDGLLCTTEMEYNGLKIDIKEAGRKMSLLNAELKETDEALLQYIPEVPDGFTFNWNSGTHTSCLVFGGTAKYSKSATYIDPATGELARRQAVESRQELDINGKPAFYSSGKKKGQPRMRNFKVPGELKTKIQEFHFEFPGYTTPDKKWATAHTDALGYPVYSVAADVITELGSRNIPFLKLLSKRQDLTKDLGTYYVTYDEKKKEYKGMLVCVDKVTHLVHHSLHHTLTVTTRLSSSNPNLQNIPKEGTSEVKKMFISRFEGGKMLELDYKQLEIVVQALLSMDAQMITDLIKQVDFHCKRVALLKNCTYEQALHNCTTETFPEYKAWKEFRNKCKIFSFQRAYGAGAALIAESTGMDIDTVKDLIEKEEKEYPDLVNFNQTVEKVVKTSATAFRDAARGFRTFRRGQYQSPTGTIYSFRSYDSPDFLRKKGILDSFKPTELKNYPVQGTGGEVVQIALGKLWRHFVANDNYSEQALLCNTVHDCVWIDSKPEIHYTVAKDARRILEDIPVYLRELYGIESPVPFPVEAEAGDNLYNKSPIHFN